MKHLKPEHNLDPEVAFVAILHHDKLLLTISVSMTLYG